MLIISTPVMSPEVVIIKHFCLNFVNLTIFHYFSLFSHSRWQLVASLFSLMLEVFYHWPNELENVIFSCLKSSRLQTEPVHIQLLNYYGTDCRSLAQVRFFEYMYL